MGWNNKFAINYFYFGFLFVCLAAVHVFHLLLVETTTFSIHALFIVDAILQSLFEVVFLALIGQMVRFFLPSIFFKFITISILVLFLMQLIDFPLVRLMDITIWYALSIVTDETFSNFIEMLRASSVTLRSWIFFGVVLVALPFLGHLLFKISEKAAMRKKWEVSYGSAITFLWILPCFLAFWDFCTMRDLPVMTSMHMQKILPLKATFFTPKLDRLTLPATLRPLEEEKEILKEIETRVPVLEKKPDIFLFVIESLREDFITSPIAPALSQFRNQNFGFDLAYANANATQISWFSLFYSAFPFHWPKSAHRSWKMGSIPLQMMKKMGYTIHVYSSASLAYYYMDERILGEKRHLADSFYFASHDGEIEAWESDAKTMANLKEDMKKNEGKEGHLYLIFLDSTHFDYSWPKDTHHHFTPIRESIDYLMATCSKEDLEGIKNRYRNALHYIDTLFGKFMADLNLSDQGKESVVVVTGDHGEEFYEHGHLFHASNLTEEQTRVPLYYRFGQNSELPSERVATLTSHMDVFPTLFHYLLKKDLSSPLLAGESIFQENKWPFLVTARFNAGRSPNEFFIHNGYYKLMLRFDREREVLKSSGLYILSVKDLYDETIPHNPTFIHEEFGGAISHLFSP